MTQTAIPFLFMRGGSSRGPYMNRADLPADQDRLAAVLVAAVGSGHPLNIDGIGGGNAVTTKVAMLSPSDSAWADIDYFFAQVSVEDGLVDFKPTCGNILTGVGPAAIEMGLMPATDGVTEVRICAVNTGARVLARVQTPGGVVSYAGDAAIDGVPGTAAPVELNFMDVAGSSTGAFLPTGNLIDRFSDIDVTCMDVAMPMVIARAADFGLTGHESREELDANRAFFAAMEDVRLQAGTRMGLGDCREFGHAKIWSCRACGCARCDHHSLFYAVVNTPDDGGYRQPVYGILCADSGHCGRWHDADPGHKTGGNHLAPSDGRNDSDDRL